MEEKNKEYEVIGRVIIGTDEYRDLIEDNKDKEAQIKELDNKKSEYYWEKYKLERDLDELRPKYEELLLFINECDGVKDKLKLWRLERVEDDE